jgi:hypothetical protein
LGLANVGGASDDVAGPVHCDATPSGPAGDVNAGVGSEMGTFIVARGSVCTGAFPARADRTDGPKPLGGGGVCTVALELFGSFLLTHFSSSLS